MISITANGTNLKIIEGELPGGVTVHKRAVYEIESPVFSTNGVMATSGLVRIVAMLWATESNPQQKQKTTAMWLTLQCRLIGDLY